VLKKLTAKFGRLGGYFFFARLTTSEIIQKTQKVSSKNT
jgi:hypothetical protein